MDRTVQAAGAHRRRPYHGVVAAVAGVAVLLLAAQASLAAAPQRSHLQAYFPGDGSATEVVNNASGTLEGDATFAAGQRLQAFSLDGTGDAIEFPAASWQLPAGDFSVVAWVKTTQATGSQMVIEEYECAGFCPGNDASSMWRLGVDNGKAVGIVRDNGTAAGATEVVGGDVADGAWHHIGFVRDTSAGKARIYVDGALTGSLDLTADMDGPLANADGEDDPVVIGAHIVGGTANLEQFFAGSIDEVGFYDVALGKADMAAIAALAPAGIRLDDASTPTERPSLEPSQAAASASEAAASPSATAIPTLPNTASTDATVGRSAGSGGVGIVLLLGLLLTVLIAGAGLLVRSGRRPGRQS
ncbi:MAG TPA: LamG domain-containing protein [Candidatus Limnocylindrales bacterium]